MTQVGTEVASIADSTTQQRLRALSTSLEARAAGKTHRLGLHDITAVRSVDLMVQPNALTAISGPSGAGKSTLLHLLGGLDRPTEGEILLGGVPTSSLRDAELTRLRRQTIGFVFQFFNLLPTLSAWQNVALPARISGMSRSDARRRALSLLGLVGLGDRVDHLPTQLSGGQQQRVAIARALVMDPPVVLADEPTGNLDQQTGSDIVTLLRSLTQSKAVVVVTHDAAVASCADIRMVMVDGELSDASSGSGPRHS